MNVIRFEYGQVAARQLGDFKRKTDTPVETYPRGRRCRCGWKLSIYNPGPECTRCETPVCSEAA